MELENGPTESIEVTQRIDSRYANRRRMRLITGGLRARCGGRLKRGDIGGILRRACEQQSFAAPALGDVSVMQEIAARLAGHRAVLVLDHNMGGGANHYRREVIDARVKAGASALLCTYNLPLLEYRVHLFQPGEAERVWGALVVHGAGNTGRGRARLRALREQPATSFDEPLLLAEWLARMRMEHPEVRLTLTAHDYFSVCPSFVLLNAEGRFCGIPATTVCSECLKRHEASYVALSPPSDIGPWRALWGRCLAAADEVRCFSEASRRLILRAYPGLAPEKVTVVPHVVDFHPPRQPKSDPGAALVIGVMGEISPQKGAHVVTGMIREIERRGIDARIVVLGTLHAAVKSPRLTVTGAYDRAHLVDLIEANGINMFLFPSIWPETFSYVVAELIALDMPVVAFELGAPAERLRGYPKARMCAEATAPAALATLTAFHRELGGSPLAA